MMCALLAAVLASWSTGVGYTFRSVLENRTGPGRPDPPLWRLALVLAALFFFWPVALKYDR
jgi:hypothetical protein